MDEGLEKTYEVIVRCNGEILYIITKKYADLPPFPSLYDVLSIFGPMPETTQTQHDVKE